MAQHGRIRSGAGLLLAAFLSGCTLIPEYHRPEAPVPATWTPEAAPAAAAEPVGETKPLRWKEFFVDERLRAVIGMALENNRDLRVAALNVEKARAGYRIQRSELYPSAGVLATGEKYRLPEKMTDSGNAEFVEQYSVNFGVASWELDFFGRIRSLERRALELYLATEEAQLSARTALVATTAEAWLEVGAAREAVDLTRATLEAQERSADLIRKTRDAGMTSDLDVRQAESLVDYSRVEIARLSGLEAVARNGLELVVGRPVPPELLPERLSEVAERRQLPPGLPSEILLARPDIAGAEHLLKGANANIGALRANFFPRISLTGGIGTLSPELSGLFDSGTGTWSFTPQIIAPIFAGGALRAAVAAGEADRDIAVAQYEKAVQVAFREVKDVLALRSTLAAQRDAQDSLARNLQEFHRLAKARFDRGLDNYLGVLVAEKASLSARQGLVGIRLAEEANLVTLYKVLGGDAPAAASTTTATPAVATSPSPAKSE